MAVTSVENDDYPLEFGVPYFQTNPYELSQFTDGILSGELTC